MKTRRNAKQNATGDPKLIRISCSPYAAVTRASVPTVRRECGEEADDGPESMKKKVDLHSI